MICKFSVAPTRASADYSWYVKVSDGEYTTTSPAWTFRTLNVSMDLRYSYDAAGRLTSVQYPSGMTESYTYDSAGNRMVQANSVTGTTYYAYDSAGNRMVQANSVTGTTYYAYDSENKLIYTNSSGSITKYDYDGMGNTISGPTGTTTYDYERRLTSITLPSGDTVRYKYLPDGTRIMRANSTETEYYLYDREDRIGDYDENGNLIIAYTHGPGIDEPAAMTVNGSTYFYIPDIQGSIRAIADINGNLMASYVYDVWGNLISHDGPLSEKNDYLYTGREYDWETGIYYYRTRSYNPEIGRFMQSSWELNEEMNMYVYVNNDPVKGTDPTGHPYFPPLLVDHAGGSGSYAAAMCSNMGCFVSVIVDLCGLGNYWLCTIPSSYSSTKKVDACNACFNRHNVTLAWNACCRNGGHAPPVGISGPGTNLHPAVMSRSWVRMVA